MPQHIGFGDEIARRMQEHIEGHIDRTGLASPPSESDAANEPVAVPAGFAGIDELDLADRGIRSVVFATGFSADFSWLRLPVVDDRGAPIHVDGRSPVPGLWFLGFPWLRTRESRIIWGAATDGAAIIDEVVARTGASS